MANSTASSTVSTTAMPKTCYGRHEIRISEATECEQYLRGPKLSLSQARIPGLTSTNTCGWTTAPFLDLSPIKTFAPDSSASFTICTMFSAETGLNRADNWVEESVFGSPERSWLTMEVIFGMSFSEARFWTMTRSVDRHIWPEWKSAP